MQSQQTKYSFVLLAVLLAGSSVAACSSEGDRSPVDGAAADAPPEPQPDARPQDAMDAPSDGAVACFPPGGVRQWGTPLDDEVLSVAVDRAGRLYVAGYVAGVGGGTVEPEGKPIGFIEQWVGGPSGARAYRYLTSSDGADVVDTIAARDGGRLVFAGRHSKSIGYNPPYDLVVGELDHTGNVVSSIQDGTSAPEHPVRIAEMMDGTIVVAGFDDLHISGNYVENWEDSFVFLWRAAAGPNDRSWFYDRLPGPDTFRALALDHQHTAIYVGGAAAAQGARRGASVSRIGDDGTIAWTKGVGAGSLDDVVAMQALPDGGLLVLGNTTGKLGEQSYGQSDSFVMKLAPGTRETVWTSQFGTSGADYARDIAVDASGAIHVVGEIPRADSGDYDLVVWSLMPDGTRARSVEKVSPGHDRPTSVAIGPCGEIVVAGATSGALDPNAAPRGSDDAFVLTVPPLTEERL